MRLDNAYSYDRIRVRSEELDRILIRAADDAELFQDDAEGVLTVASILEARIENKKIQALATESIHEIEYTLLADENVDLATENYELRAEVLKLDTELGELRLASETTETSGPVGWMSGGYNLPEIDDGEVETLKPNPNRMTLLETRDAYEDDAEDHWPSWLMFKKGDRVRDHFSGLTGDIIGWSESTDRYRIVYSMSTGSGYPIEGYPEEFTLITTADEAEVEKVADEVSTSTIDDEEAWAWFD